MDDYQEIQQLYSQLKTVGERYMPLWKDISNVVGITVHREYGRT